MPAPTAGSAGPDTGFERSLAVVVGVDAYDALPPLTAAVADARAVAAALAAQGYTVELCVDADATTRAALLSTFDALPDRLGPDDRVLIYFAGHGVAEDGEDAPQGYLAPRDAAHDDLGTLIPMAALYALVCQRIACRHRLLVLDCCFAGSFSWTATRMARRRGGRGVSRHRHRRYVAHPAVQVLTSAAADQKALDVVDGMTIGRRPVVGGHSPFALALLDGLGGGAGRGDGADRVVTATALYLHIRDAVEERTDERQTPGLWPLAGHGRGEYVFWPAGAPADDDLPEDPRLDARANPWPGLSAYGAEQGDLFFGRDAEIDALCDRLADPDAPWLVAVVAASGTGKSSLVRAGLLPRLAAADERTIIGPLRPGPTPERAVRDALAQLEGAIRPVVVIDQFEEVFTLGCPEGERDRVFAALAALAERPGLNLVLTLRADFEGYVGGTALGPALRAGRVVLGPMTREGLRDVILRPAERRVLFFEPPSLVDTLIDEVVALPGGLPLLAFTLAEMYRAHVESDAADRTLTRAHHDALGGVVGALRTRASALYDAADAAEQACIRRLMLRLVSGDAERARRRATADELRAADADAQRRMEAVVERFVAARLLVRGAADGPDGRRERYVEPAHDVLVRGWDRIYGWVAEARDVLPLQQALWRAARGWRDAGEPAGRLWTDDPRLPQARTPAVRADLNALERRFVDASAARRRRRRVTLAGAVLAVMAALAGAAVYALGEAERADAHAATAEIRRREAEAQTALARAATRRAVAERELPRDPTTAALVLAEQPVSFGASAHRLLVDVAHRPGLAVAVLRGHDQAVTRATFDPSGRWVATAALDGSVRIWPADGRGAPRVLGGHTATVRSLAFSPDGARILTASADTTARLWPADGRGAPVVLDGHEAGLMAAVFSPDGSRIATADHAELTRIWPADGRGTPVELRMREGMGAVAFDPTGARVATVGWGSVPRIWRADGRDAPVTLPEREGVVPTLRWSPDGRWILTPAWDSTVALTAADGRGPHRVLRGHRDAVHDARFDPSGDRFVTASGDGTARIWWVDGRREPIVLEGHSDTVGAASFDATGRRVLTASSDGTARVWSADGDAPPVVLRGHTRAVTRAAFAPDGARVVTASEDATARIWRIGRDAGEVRTLPGVGAAVQHAAIGPAARRVAIVTADGHARLGDISTARWQALEPLEAPVRALAFSASGDAVVTVDAGCLVQRWSASDGRPLGAVAVPDPHCDQIAIGPAGDRLVAWSRQRPPWLWSWTAGGAPEPVEPGPHGVLAWLDPRGAEVAVWSWDGAVTLASVDGRHPPDEIPADYPQVTWDRQGTSVLVTGVSGETPTLWTRGGIGPVPLAPGTAEGQWLVAAFSDDGDRVALGDLGGAIAAVALDRPDALVALGNHLTYARTLAFSADGTRIVSASSDRTARVWSAEGSHPPLTLRHDRAVLAARFMPGDTRVLTVAEDGEARVWLTDPDALRRHVDAHIHGCLPVDFRVADLGESPAEATAARAACRRRKGLDLLAGP